MAEADKEDMNKALFITVEGMDGSGKTTQFKLIEEYLVSRGRDVVAVRDPGGTRIGERIRNIILDPDLHEMDYITELMLCASSRAQLVRQIIKPALSDGKTVLCDRFIDSNIAYQGYGRDIGVDEIIRVNNLISENFNPDITFFFNLSPGEAVKRRKNQACDRMENEDMAFHEKVYAGYLKLAYDNPERIVNIDCTKDIESVFKDVSDVLDKKFKGEAV